MGAMRFKYQIIFFGDIANPACSEIGKRISEKVHEMGLLEETLEVIGASSFDQSYDNKQPAFAYYFGKEGHDNCDEEILKVLLANGDAIILVCFKEGNFENEMPEVYVIGQLYVDLFEESELPDMALSNRQGYKSDDERYVRVITYVRDHLLPEIVNMRVAYAKAQKASFQRAREERRSKGTKLKQEECVKRGKHKGRWRT